MSKYIAQYILKGGRMRVTRVSRYDVATRGTVAIVTTPSGNTRRIPLDEIFDTDTEARDWLRARARASVLEAEKRLRAAHKRLAFAQSEQIEVREWTG